MSFVLGPSGPDLGPEPGPELDNFQVDTDKCKETKAAHGVKVIPTFVLFRNKIQIDKMKGARNMSLEDLIKKQYGDEGSESEEVGVKNDSTKTKKKKRKRKKCTIL